MKLTADQQKKGAAIGIFAVLAAGILYYQLRDDSPAPRSAPVTTAQVPAVKSSSSGTAAKSISTSAQLDPTLRMAAMLAAEHVPYNGNGRNIFSANSVPVEIPKPIASVRPKQMQVAAAPAAPVGPPPPPPIELKFFGTATAPGGKLEAFLLHGQDVFLATDGEIVQRRYKVITVAANSIVVEDMAFSNRQTLPRVAR